MSRQLSSPSCGERVARGVLANGFPRVQEDHGGGLPIAGRAGPTLRARGPGRLVEGMAPREQVGVFTAVTLVGGDEFNAAVAMRAVVAANEKGHPMSSFRCCVHDVGNEKIPLRVAIRR